VAVPPALRPVLRFRRLPPAALETVVAVIEADAAFRARVAAGAEEHDVGRIAWLWLTRPEGWEDDLARLVGGLAETETARAEREADRQLRRRLEGAERAAARAESRAVRLEAELDRARRELDELRAERDRLEARGAELERTARELAEQRAAAVADLKRVEALLARRTEERRALEAQVTDLTTRGAEPPGHLVDPEALRPLLARLGRTAQALAGDVAALRRDLGGLDGEPEQAAPAGGARARRRIPLPVPAGLTDESVEAAAHLLGRPRAALLVDGYNVSMAAWPEAELADQRDRLERLLADLVARTPGLSVELVFDGADIGPIARPGPRRAPGVTVRFTPPEVEADDLLLELVGRFPATRPVIVASSDRRVRDGARRKGANVLSAAQLLAAARL
jgi:predicted RNA-binding protein with PIN domain